LGFRAWGINAAAFTLEGVQAIGDLLDICFLFGLIDLCLDLFDLRQYFPFVIFRSLNVSFEVFNLFNLFL
jgi:hypothetical protein